FLPRPQRLPPHPARPHRGNRSARRPAIPTERPRPHISRNEPNPPIEIPSRSPPLTPTNLKFFRSAGTLPAARHPAGLLPALPPPARLPAGVLPARPPPPHPPVPPAVLVSCPLCRPPPP